MNNAQWIGVAEKVQAMTYLLQWYKKSQQQCNLPKITTGKDKKAAGIKGINCNPPYPTFRLYPVVAVEPNLEGN